MKFLIMAVFAAFQLALPTSACVSRWTKEDDLIYISLKKNRLVRETIDLSEASMGPPAKLGDDCIHILYNKHVKPIYISDYRIGYRLSIYERSDMLYELIQWVRQSYNETGGAEGVNKVLRRQLCMGLSLMYCNENNKCDCLNGDPFLEYQMVSENIDGEDVCVVQDGGICNPQSLLFCEKSASCVRDFDYANAKFLPSCTCQKSNPDSDPDLSSNLPEFSWPENTYDMTKTWYASTEQCTTTSGKLPYRYRPRSYQ